MTDDGDAAAVVSNVAVEVDADAEDVNAVVWGSVHTGKPSRVGLLMA